MSDESTTPPPQVSQDTKVHIHRAELIRGGAAMQVIRAFVDEI
jgi:hypothetical protein